MILRVLKENRKAKLQIGTQDKQAEEVKEEPTATFELRFAAMEKNFKEVISQRDKLKQENQQYKSQLSSDKVKTFEEDEDLSRSTKVDIAKAYRDLQAKYDEQNKRVSDWEAGQARAKKIDFVKKYAKQLGLKENYETQLERLVDFSKIDDDGELAGMTAEFQIQEVKNQFPDLFKDAAQSVNKYTPPRMQSNNDLPSHINIDALNEEYMKATRSGDREAAEALMQKISKVRKFQS